MLVTSIFSFFLQHDEASIGENMVRGGGGGIQRDFMVKDKDRFTDWLYGI